MSARQHPVAVAPAPEILPSIVARAGQRLLDAHTSAEVLEAKQIAEMALHYARVTQAANETHADCLRIITRAEIRMADEIDRGQASGQVARAGRPENVPASDISSAAHMHLDNEASWPAGHKTSTLEELGVDRRRVSEWREVRDAGPAVLENAIQSALSEGRAPTKADITKHVRGTFGTGENEWYTPDEHLELARAVLGEIDLDPASSEAAQERVRAAEYFTKDDDGLKHEWHGKVWLNPPYSQPWIADFVSKLCLEIRHGRVSEAILLTHNYTDTAWFHEAAAECDAICFTRGRIKFYSPDGAVAAPTQGQAFFYFGQRAAEFAAQFRSFGLVAAPVSEYPRANPGDDLMAPIDRCLLSVQGAVQQALHEMPVADWPGLIADVRSLIEALEAAARTARGT